MSSPFLAEIKMFAGNFAPRGYATCDGQILSISQNTALFSLLGTFYGGNGQTNFALPNFQGNVPIHQGNGPGLTPRSVGETGGSQIVTLLQSELPAHSHAFQAIQGAATSTAAAGNLLAVNRNLQPYAAPAATVSLDPSSIGLAGGGGPHNNLQPYLVVMFIIALQGIFPARN
jgi:microcystin-dependent protein